MLSPVSVGCIKHLYFFQYINSLIESQSTFTGIAFISLSKNIYIVLIFVGGRGKRTPKQLSGSPEATSIIQGSVAYSSYDPLFRPGSLQGHQGYTWGPCETKQQIRNIEHAVLHGLQPFKVSFHSPI